MAIFRSVQQIVETRKWAYWETSDENPFHLSIIGGKEFETKQEALDYQNEIENEENKYIIMDFGAAIKALKRERKVQRIGWNGKGMYLLLITSGNYGLDVEKYKHLREQSIGLLPWIGMKTADDRFVPWLASQTDILADDWMTVE